MSLIGKLRTEARRLKGEVLALYEAARHPGTPWYAKLVIVAIVAYALSPIDLIPDFIPVLGFLDEIVLLPIGIALALKMIPTDVMAECRARASASAGHGTRLGRIGAGVIVVLWLALIVSAGLWAHSAFSREHVPDALLGMSAAVPRQGDDEVERAFRPVQPPLRYTALQQA